MMMPIPISWSTLPVCFHIPVLVPAIQTRYDNDDTQPRWRYRILRVATSLRIILLLCVPSNLSTSSENHQFIIRSSDPCIVLELQVPRSGNI
ncbi:hypothetical protein BXZ70DRAFT_304293 [Cristinia sonorae]|uniref:Uncharacterized protein n=1 Tax=Cristinia sonorae TaxID=1940300 RepID=A0A8K0UKE8_9AGAR|nr:hypothetical protein BXZ70DRAFT_304293 [Cristinia sonorae]